MTIDAVSAATSATSSSTTSSSGGLQGSKDEFLKLFMAQLENQDPLNPQDGAGMVAQLAQFSQVEQAEQTNQQLSSLAAAQSSTASAGMSNLVGRTCDVATGDFTLDTGGAPPPIDVTATGPMKGASVVITDSTGKEIRRIPIADGASSAEIAWDGKDSSGTNVHSGGYHVAIDPGTSTSTITSNWHGRIDSVELTADGPRLRMGDLLFSPSDVRSIGAEQVAQQIATATTALGAHV